MRSALIVPAIALVAGVAIGLRAYDVALHPSLRAVLDREFGGFALESLGPGGAHAPIPSRVQLTEDAAVQGDVVSLRGDVVALRLRDAWQPAAGGVLITVGGSARQPVGEWRAGRVIEAPMTYRRPARYLDEGVADQEADVALGGTALYASIKSALLVTVVARGHWFDEQAARVRAFVRRAVARWVGARDPVSGAIVTAVLIGDRSSLPDDVRLRLQAAGTYHVIAISGGNIAILAALVYGVLALSMLHGRLTALVAAAAVIAYAQVATPGPSVWRATIMATLYLLARTFDHRVATWHSLALAAALMATLAPLDVRNAGFVLTFGATAALLVVSGLAARVARTHAVLGWLAASAIASLAVEVVLLPVSAAVFSRITAAGVLLNLLAVPVMGLVQVTGLVVTACERWPLVAGPAGWLAHVGSQVLIESARIVERWPWLTHRVPPPSPFLIVLYYAGLLAALRCLRGLRHAAVVVTMIAGLAIVTGTPLTAVARAPTSEVRLTLWDVGQGESMLLEMPDGRRVMVDAGGPPFGGGSFDIGARVLAPALWSRGVRALDALAITHGDPDHIGGASSIIADFMPREVWTGIDVPHHGPTRELHATAHARGIAERAQRAGHELTYAGARLRILNPPAPDWERPRVRNDDSLVIEVVYRDVALLLTGDIGADVERTIAPLLTATKTRILKVAHHGSKTSTSSSLLDTWRPQIALISAGRGNTFGHPAPEVIQRLEAIGARIYRTDRDGQITVTTDGYSVGIRTLLDRRQPRR